VTITRVLYDTWRVLYWLLLLVLGFIALVWWENRHDDPLLPEVAEAIRFEPPTPQAMRDNGYFILLGLRAPPDEDATEAGQHEFATLLQDYENYQRTGKLKPFIEETYPDMSEVFCSEDVSDCYAHYLKHAQTIRSKLSEQAVLIERYLTLRDKPTYKEVTTPAYFNDTSPYRYGDAARASALIDMRVVLLLNESRIDEALTLLETNAKIHQKMMNGACSLTGAMIALAMDMRQQRLLSSALRHVPVLSANHGHRLDTLLKTMPVPLTDTFECELKWSLGSHAREMKIHPPVVFDDLIEALDHRIRDLIYLPNATLNTMYLLGKENIQLSQLSPDQLKVEIATGRADRIGDVFPLHLRNFAGNILASIAVHDRVSYLERAHDVAAYHRLIRLQIAALRERVPFEQMPTWLADQPPELRNPYTLEPMSWDAATQSLVFTGANWNTQNPEPKNVFRVYLGKP
jgi:hypothetical protein